jgi:hypothetical protein
VPHRVEGVGAEALAPQHQRIPSVLAAPEAAGGMRAKQIAVALGEPAVPARVEGVRSRNKVAQSCPSGPSSAKSLPTDDPATEALEAPRA